MIASGLGPAGLLPEYDFGGGRLRALLFCEWETPFDERCVFLGERLLNDYGSKPVEGSGGLVGPAGEQNSAYGDYKKIRPKLIQYLSHPENNNPSMWIRGGPRENKRDFFPFALEWSLGLAHGGQKFGSFAVDESQVPSASDHADRAAPIIFQGLGSAYGGCWDFPSELGADGYSATVSTMPRDMKWGADTLYNARLTRWRDNIWRRKLRARQGYFREIYPINFLLDAHLNAPFEGAPLADFMKKFGALRRCEFNEKMHRWDVPEANLAEVRTALEPSGLVLSSATEPATLI